MGKMQIGDKFLYRCKTCGAETTGMCMPCPPAVVQQIGVKQTVYLLSVPCEHAKEYGQMELVRKLKAETGS
jgi:hypothetical protein